MRAFLKDVSEHTASNLADMQWEIGVTPDLRITRWDETREWLQVFWVHLRYLVGARICKRFGHSSAVEVEDFVAAERDERGRIVDIDGGGVDWFCPRCGQGGRSWF